MPVDKDQFTAAVSDAANAAQAFLPTIAHVRRELGNLLNDALWLEANAERLVRALKRLQRSNLDAS